MTILALDPGAKRCGWAVLSEGSGEIKYRASGILGLAQPSNYQEQRLLLIEYWVSYGHQLLNSYDPTVVVSETLPPVGGNIASIINRQLGLTALTAVQTLAVDGGLPLAQYAASTVKKHVTGLGKASKVTVRNGVLALLPELEPRRPEWTGKNAVWDEVDALAIGLTYYLAEGLIGKPEGTPPGARPPTSRTTGDLPTLPGVP